MTLYTAVAGEVIFGREHTTYSGDLNVVVSQYFQSLIDLVAEVRTVMVAVKLDEFDACIGEAFGACLQGLQAETPVAPGKIQAVFETVGMGSFELLELLLNLLIFLLEVLKLHFSAPKKLRLT